VTKLVFFTVKHLGKRAYWRKWR